MIRGVLKILKGEYHRVSYHVHSSSEIDKSDVQECFDKLEKENILEHVLLDFYVMQNLTDKEEEEAIELIRELGAQLDESEKVHVEVGGELIENYSYTTDKEPSEIVW